MKIWSGLGVDLEAGSMTDLEDFGEASEPRLISTVKANAKWRWTETEALGAKKLKH